MFGLNDNEAFDNRDFHPSGPIYSFIYHNPFINISIAYRHKLIISPTHSVSFRQEQIYSVDCFVRGKIINYIFSLDYFEEC